MDCTETILVVLGVIIFLALLGGICKCAMPEGVEGFQATKGISSPKKVQEMAQQGILYNPLYTSPDIRSPGSFIYTQPMGDVDASAYASASEGTSGGFLPLQGRAAGVFMKNSSAENLALPSKDIGNIGGFPNYTGNTQTSRMTAGFNDIGAPFQDSPGIEDKDFSNSYLLDGANRRVCNSGQKCPNLPAQDWWPTVKKEPNGFALQASDAMVFNDPNDPEPGIQRFLRSKFTPQWKSIFNKSL
jgi:hypothetical protein